MGAGITGYDARGLSSHPDVADADRGPQLKLIFSGLIGYV
jgi:hypothetical protein